MVFRAITYGSEEYGRECSLRNQVLRAPLGLSLQKEDLAQEKDHLHFGLFESDGTLVGCVMAVPLSANEVRIRQMAVIPSRQRMGFGARIMDELEMELVARGFSRFVLHARVSAVGFYEKRGYAVTGVAFLEVTIPHVRMEKMIPQNAAEKY